jgi:hypothetical protein
MMVERMPTTHHVIVDIKIGTNVSLNGEARKAGLGRKKGWFQRFYVGVLPQRGRSGAFVLIERTMKRVGFGDWYSEKVIDRETGEVINYCEEPLSVHQGHGSAKVR